MTTGVEVPRPDDLAQALGASWERHPEVTAVFLYGSAAEGGPSRDLDFAVSVDRSRVRAVGDVDLALSLAGEFSQALEWPADVVVINDAPLALRYAASRGRVVLARDAEVVARFKERTWDEYFDFRPVALGYFREAW